MMERLVCVAISSFCMESTSATTEAAMRERQIRCACSVQRQG